jgi:hypothetical protein
MKKIFFILIALFSSLIIYFLLFGDIRQFLSKKLDNSFKDKVKTLILGSEDFKDIRYYKSLAYNQKKFPETQFEKLKLEFFDLDSSNKETSTIYNQKMNLSGSVNRFFIENYNERIFIIYSNGTFFFLDNNLKIKNNFNEELNGISIKGSLIHKDDLFISYSWSADKEESNKKSCKYMKVAKASLLDKNLLNFIEIFKSKDCNEGINGIGGGKMIYNNSINPSILLTTDAQFENKKLAQDLNSAFGKVIKINLTDFKFDTYSSGHRNPMGLINFNNNIILTEHGPCGGDEINLLVAGKNYGWPIISEGDDYIFCRNFENSIDYEYLKENFDKAKYTNPIFSFIPSIGISAIINIPNDFSKYWQNNFFIASLAAGSLYRVKFDENFTKILFVEKIFIGTRIIDIKYDKKTKSFLLAFEQINKVGKLSVNKKNYN